MLKSFVQFICLLIITFVILVGLVVGCDWVTIFEILGFIVIGFWVLCFLLGMFLVFIAFKAVLAASKASRVLLESK